MSYFSAHNESTSEDEDSNQFSRGIDVGPSEVNWKEFISSFPTNITSNEQRRRKQPRAEGQRVGRIFTDEAAKSESSSDSDTNSGKRVWLRHWGGNSSVSGRYGESSASKSLRKSDTKSKECYEEEYNTCEDSAESFAGSPSRQFLRSFGTNLDNECVYFSDGETEVRRTESDEEQGFMPETGIYEPDLIVEDNIKIDSPQTETERMRRFVMECIQNHPLRFRVIHDVFAIQNERLSNRNISRICEQGGNSGRAFKGSIFFVCNHAGDHLHVVHDCSYNENSCRCQRVKEIRSECGNPRLNRRLLRHVRHVQANIGSISQSISKQANGKQYILKSPGECGLNVVKLETYPFAKICGLEKKNW
ncbi:hypothetical protein ABMA28_003613 [Loxostege sticticalis]|uniref:Uncharacterized protein n=1 Tax=Loxostege sticticalis TaxID=481309 RepID=A0ABD0SXS7_LOXSC